MGEEGENFLVVADEGTVVCDKDERLWMILEREGKKEFDWKKYIAVSFVYLDLTWKERVILIDVAPSNWAS